MLVKNPYRYYPRFTARIVYTDGRVVVRRGLAEDAELYFPGEEEDIRAIAMVIQDASHLPVAEAMWVDGDWRDYDEELFDQLENGVEDEPELESEPEPEPAVEEEPELTPDPWYDEDDE